MSLGRLCRAAVFVCRRGDKFSPIDHLCDISFLSSERKKETNVCKSLLLLVGGSYLVAPPLLLLETQEEKFHSN